MSDSAIRRIISLLVVALLGTPVVAVLAKFTGAPLVMLAVGVVAMLVAGLALQRHLPAEATAFVRQRPLIAAVWLLVVLVALAQVVRLSVFMYDANRTDWSVLPTNSFFPTHFCFSGYYEGERFARAGNVNIYDPLGYVSAGCEDATNCPERAIGPLKVDLFQYPPTFLVIPAALSLITHDFFNARALWFLVQMAAVAAGLLCTARWIGGSPGRRAAAFAPLLFVALPTLVGVQIGNIQPTTFALSLLAMVAIAATRTAAGGLVLGLMIASKMFPGLLAAWLVGALRWRAVVWVGIGMAATGGAVAAIYGLRPFQDFIAYQVPRIASGEAFFWIDSPGAIPPNYGIHGLVAKLRLLGWTDAGRDVGNVASSIYGVSLGLIALLAGWRQRDLLEERSEASRMQLAQLWLALLNLGSFRSPFVPDAYAAMGTIWLLTLLVAGRSESKIDWRSLAPLSAVILLSLVVDGFIPAQPPTWVVLLTLANQLLILGLNVWVVSRELLRSRVSVLLPPTATATA